jgi:hypothetical protein
MTSRNPSPISSVQRFRLRRRAMLKGALGVAIGLPVLEAMLDGNGRFLDAFGARKARAQSNGAPQRYAVIFAGQAIGGDGSQRNRFRLGGGTITEEGHFIVPGSTNGQGQFVPGPAGPLTVTTPLSALESAGVLGDVNLVSGLSIPFVRGSNFASDGSDVPLGGAFRDFHGGGCSPLISGTRSTTSQFRANGPTSDQLIAQLNAGQTNIPSLVLRAQPSFYLSGFDFSGREFISYTAGGTGGRVPAQTNPQIAWQSLFSTFVPDDEGLAALQDFNQRKRLSVLDLVTAKRERLLTKVGAADRIRLEQHFDELRALEQRVRAIPPPTTGTCVALDDPGAPPAIGGANSTVGSGIDLNTGYSGEAERARVMCDLIHMAFVCDLTRAATLQITAFQSHMNVRPIAQELLASVGRSGDIRGDIHEIGHNGDPDSKGQLQVSLMLKWHLQEYAYLLRKLKETPEGDGNVLDNSAIVFMPEAGHGTQLNDSSTPFATHSVEDMVLLVGGRAGGMQAGRHIPTNGAHPGKVLISAMQAVGRQANTFGEVTGALPDLFG